MASFQPAFEYVLKNEGVLTENPKDPGGITKFGISLRFLKSLKDPKAYSIYADPIDADVVRFLMMDQASAIYRREFWDQALFDRIVSQDICNYVFDMAISMGISPAIKCVQRAVWAVWRDRNILSEDGILGEKTLHWIKQSNSNALLCAVRSERAGKYRLICAENKSEEIFINGWLKRAYESET